MRRLLFFLVVSIFLLVRVSLAATPITGCGGISEPGEYYLTTDMINETFTCFFIFSSDVILDCQGHIIDGNYKAMTWGIKAENQTNITIKNCVLSNWDGAIWFEGVNNSRIVNTTVRYNWGGINLPYSRYITIENVTAIHNSNFGVSGGFSCGNWVIKNSVFKHNNYAVLVVVSNNSLVYNNIFENNTHGLRIVDSSNVTVYNNLFNNTGENVGFGGTIYPNNWNTTKTYGANIVGGPYIGGNYWGYPNGTGYSDTCTDSDLDGICDAPYTLATDNIDYLPLAKLPENAITSCRDITSPGEYFLANDIYFSGGSCIVIANSSVKIDGNNHTIRGDGSGVAIEFEGSSNKASNCEVFNLSIENVGTGILFDSHSNWATDNKVHDIKITNVSIGIKFYHHVSDFNEIYNCEINASDVAIYFYGYNDCFPANNNEIHDSKIYSSQKAIVFEATGGNRIYRNEIVGTIELRDDTSACISRDYIYNNIINGEVVNTTPLYDDEPFFNTTKQAGINIVGGPYIGGNYWIGYSENCTDSDKDGICDNPYTVLPEFNAVDYLPLAKFTPPQNPEWCKDVAPQFIITYTGSYGYLGRIDLYHNTNENTTGGTYNYTFYVDSVGVSGSGSLDENWKRNIFNTSLLDYYDGNSHTFNYTVDYFSSNGSTLCTFSGSITLNPYYETPVVIEELVTDTPSSISFSVDKRNVSAYNWQLFVFDKNWNSLYYFTNMSEERNNITQTVDLDGKSGYYAVQTDKWNGLSDGTQFFLRDYSNLKEFDYTKPPEVEEKPPTSFMKSILGLGILVSFLFFILSLISSPEISVERLLKIIGIITAILILILTYGML